MLNQRHKILTEQPADDMVVLLVQIKLIGHHSEMLFHPWRIHAVSENLHNFLEMSHHSSGYFWKNWDTKWEPSSHCIYWTDNVWIVNLILNELQKYASAFEQERIGIMELPYLTEERLNKMGIPMGPRLRILQEAQICLKPGYHGHHDGHNSHHQNNHNAGNLSVYVV